jgi:hypothetical protein
MNAVRVMRVPSFVSLAAFDKNEIGCSTILHDHHPIASSQNQNLLASIVIGVVVTEFDVLRRWIVQGGHEAKSADQFILSFSKDKFLSMDISHHRPKGSILI